MEPSWQSESVGQVVRSSCGDYNGVSPSNVSVSVENINVAAVRVNVSSLVVTEGGSGGWYSLVLLARPTSSVKVSMVNMTGVIVSPMAVTFLRSKWNVPMPVFVSAIVNSVAEGNRTIAIQHVTSSLDGNFNGLEGSAVDSVLATIVDNTQSGIAVVASSTPLMVGEGSSSTYTVKLTSQPVSNVTVTVGVYLPDGVTVTDILTVSPSSILFTAANWYKSVVVTVVGVNDDVARPAVNYRVRHVPSSSDVMYNGDKYGVSLNVQEIDNDSPGISVSPTTLSLIEGNMSVAESNSSFMLRLSTMRCSRVSVLCGQWLAQPRA